MRNAFRCTVEHCWDAFGLIVDGAAGWRLVYSGDTRPSSALVRAGAGATVLIHEATFEDSMTEDAISKRHCTVSEAVDVAQRMGAHRCILTHFSQRYPALAALPPQVAGRVLMAFDLLSVSFRDLQWAAATTPVMQCLFPAGEGGGEAAEEGE